MPRVFSIGGYLAAAVLIVLGIAVIVVGVVGRSYVQDQLQKEKIVGSDDMTPEGIKPGIQKAGLQDVSIPSCSVAGEKVDTGKEAKCFADYMRIHTLEATGGKTYAEMPQDSPQRDIWVTETALTTALYTSFFAENVALFSIIVGIVMLLVGIGFVVLTVFSRRRAPGGAGPADDTGPRSGLAPQAFGGGFGLSRSSSSETRAACQTIHAVRCESGRRAIPTITSKVPQE